MKSRLIVSLSVAALAVSALAAAYAQSAHFVPVTDEVLRSPKAADWLSWRRDRGATGYSPLDQIHVRDVRGLRLAWAWAMEPGSLEPEPLVYNGVMYLPHPNDVVQALDARTGGLIWEYRRERPKDARGGGGGVGGLQRNLAIYQDKVLVATSDAHLVALDARSGRPVWDVAVADSRQGMGYTSGPIAGDGRVFAGLQCGGSDRAQCFVSAHDINTGKELWRRTSVAGPGDPPEHNATWNGLPFERRIKASLWLPGSYDSDLKLLYWTTGSAFPYTEIAKGTGSGTLLYTQSILSLKADTGAIAWFFQMVPRDNFDLDHADNPILADLAIRGVRRKVVYTMGKTSVLWALDRQTGEHLWHRPRVDAVYSAVSMACSNFEILPIEKSSSGVNWDRMVPMQGSNGNVGRLAAVRASTGEMLWTYDQRAPMGSILTTGGGLVFAGDFHRYFRAFDAETGKVLWELPLNGPVEGYPISYAVDGKQYIAVSAGGGSVGQRHLAQLYPELKTPLASNVLMVFTLNNDAPTR